MTELPEPVRLALRTAVLVTGNVGKLEEARRLCGIDIASEDIDLPEIQSLDLSAVLEAKAREAASRLQRPVIVDETALELSALNGFPGVLVKWMLAAVGPAGVAQTATALKDERAVARCGLLYLSSSKSVVATGSVAGRLILPARGEQGFGWDSVFQPEGSSMTFAEMPPDVKDRVGHRGAAWKELLRRLAT